MSIWAQYVAEPKNIGFSNSLDLYVFGFVATLFLKYFQEKNQKIAKKQQKPKKKFFDVFASFSAFSASSQKDSNFKYLFNAFVF